MAQAKLIPLVAGHLLLTGLPGAAAALIAARRGISSIPVLLATALAATGVLAMLTFWAFFADPTFGKAFAFIVPAGSVCALAWTLRGGRIGRTVLRGLATPTALWALGTLFLVFFGFVHGGSDNPLTFAASRFRTGLPADNDIPEFFASWFYAHGHSPAPPLFGDWLASDRPPLQIGYTLSQRPFGWDTHDLNYQLLGVTLQQLWIVGLWALLVAARVGRVTRALVVAMVLVSGLAVINGFFVWPKLLPASMLLAAAALVLTPEWATVRRRRWGAALLGILLALAMLGHGSSVFAIIPLAVVAAARGIPNWRWLTVAVLAAAVLYTPWAAYQKYGDPPGNRLTKWMLAGDIGPDKLGASQAILDAYRKAGVGGTLHQKAENFVVMAGGGQVVTELENAVDSLDAGQTASALETLRAIMFFNLLPSFGLLVIAPLLMVAARCRRKLAGPEWTLALRCFVVVGVGVLAWGLILFGNAISLAVLHQGSYAIPLLGFCAAVAGLRAAYPRFAVWFVGLNALLSLALFAPVLNPPPQSSYSPAAIVIALGSLLSFVAVALQPSRWQGPGFRLTRVREAQRLGGRAGWSAPGFEDS